MSDPYSPFDELFTGGRSFPMAGAKKEEKGIPWNAKKWDGKYYVPLEQVAELLEQNGVLPKVRKGIEARVQALKDKNALDLD